MSELWLVRHGETEWSAGGRHTGRTDVPLTEAGEAQARALGAALAGHEFALVLTSPLARARETCRLAGLDDRAEVSYALVEWDYGDYEGRRTVEIREERPGWTLWADGVPNGETAAEVAARARTVIERANAVFRSERGGDVVLFAHGHVLRVLTATWLGLAPEDGRLFGLETATYSVLGYERETRVIRHWNVESGAWNGG